MPPPSWASAVNQSLIQRGDHENEEQKIRARKRETLHADAARCVKIAQMFAGCYGGA